MTPLDLSDFYLLKGVSVTALAFLALAVYRTFRRRGPR